MADGTLDSIKNRSTLAPYPKSATAADDHIHALSVAFAAFGASTRAAIDQSASLGDQATADVFTEVTRGLDKLLWMIDAHRPR
jgi:starvation-inducible DNA-binding protein